ncbi:hypothetical protein GIB67_011474 [Kingdonia uniflora]|uniref:CCHC-type domain-containing protein n=1 Tax=Kingdonia uniflora TaxID=39325 RepID=A0A7J7NLJ9_9MAGN|nr:hypothetical protein GIB67_011474 [Kingdonia uniflora]
MYGAHSKKLRVSPRLSIQNSHDDEMHTANAIQRKVTPDRKRTSLRGINASDHSENSKPMDNTHSRVLDQHRRTKVSAGSLNRSMNLMDKSQNSTYSPVQGRGVSPLKRPPSSLQKSQSEVASQITFDQSGKVQYEKYVGASSCSSERPSSTTRTTRSQSMPFVPGSPRTPSPSKASLSKGMISPSRTRQTERIYLSHVVVMEILVVSVEDTDYWTEALKDFIREREELKINQSSFDHKIDVELGFQRLPNYFVQERFWKKFLGETSRRVIARIEEVSCDDDSNDHVDPFQEGENGLRAHIAVISSGSDHFDLEKLKNEKQSLSGQLKTCEQNRLIVVEKVKLGEIEIEKLRLELTSTQQNLEVFYHRVKNIDKILSMYKNGSDKRGLGFDEQNVKSTSSQVTKFIKATSTSFLPKLSIIDAPHRQTEQPFVFNVFYCEACGRKGHLAPYCRYVPQLRGRNNLRLERERHHRSYAQSFANSFLSKSLLMASGM